MKEFYGWAALITYAVMVATLSYFLAIFYVQRNKGRQILNDLLKYNSASDERLHALRCNAIITAYQALLEVRLIKVLRSQTKLPIDDSIVQQEMINIIYEINSLAPVHAQGYFTVVRSFSGSTGLKINFIYFFASKKFPDGQATKVRN